MTILIDVGNTAIKWQLREAEQVVCTDKGDTDELLSWLNSLADPLLSFGGCFLRPR
jgi:pantothenate kinase type III